MIFNGKKIAEQIFSEIKTQVRALPFRPIFCDVLVGNDPVSLSYVKIKAKKAVEVGMVFLPAFLPEKISQADLEAKIIELNNTVNLCGLIIQLPLPKGLDQKRALDAVSDELDVDGMNSQNQRKFYAGEPTMVMPTAAAIGKIFETLKVGKEKQVVVVGQGDLVGRPTAQLLRYAGYTVLTADRSTQDLKTLCLKADVLVAATGSPRLISGEMVKPGCIVIDAGTSELGGSIVGDVEATSVAKVAGVLTPVPGGVGPLTVAMLFWNVLTVAKLKAASGQYK